MNKKKIFIISGIVIAIAAIYYFIFYKKVAVAKPAVKNTGTNNSGSSGSITDTNTVKPKPLDTLPEGQFPLKPGSHGVEVLYLQAILNLHNSANLALDGIWGPATTTAIQKNYPNFGGSVSYVNYRKMYSQYADTIHTYLNGRGLV